LLAGGRTPRQRGSAYREERVANGVPEGVDLRCVIAADHRGQPDAGGIEERVNLRLVIARVVAARGELLAADVVCSHRGSCCPEERVANLFAEGVDLRSVIEPGGLECR
jgi:hypothetical protein